MSKTPDWEGALTNYSEGGSDVEVAKILNITIGRFFQLYEETPTFADFVDKGRTLSQAWWYETGRKALFTKEFNPGLYNFVMKNRFGWADKVESTDATNKDPVNLDQMRGQLNSALVRLGKKNPELLSGANLTLVTSTERDND